MMTEFVGDNLHHRHSGSALLVVLGIVMVVTILSMTFLSKSDMELIFGNNMLARLTADYLAESALENARGIILNPQQVTGSYWHGATGLQIDSGNYYYDVAIEPNLAYSGPTRWCSYDITSSAYRQVQNRRTTVSNLKALLRLDPCIAFWSDFVSDNQISQAVTINGDVYSAGHLISYGIINGDVFCPDFTLGPSAVKTGQEKPTEELSLSFPDIIIDRFVLEYSTQVIPSSISNDVLGPYDPPRIFRSIGDMILGGNVHINGMLLVEGNLTIEGADNFIISQKNLPALMVTGDLKITKDAYLDIQGLAVIEGQMQVNVGCEDVNILGALFTKQGLVETTSDSSVNSYNAVVLGNPIWQPAGGRITGAVELDGVDDIIEQYDAPDYLNGLTALTVSIWVKSHRTGEDRGIFFTREPSELHGELGLRYANVFGKPSCIRASIQVNGDYILLDSTANTQTTSWQHLALVWETGQPLKLYIDGQLDSQSTSTLFGSITGTQKLLIGRGAIGNTWDGLIDDMRIYNQALEEAEIVQVMNGQEITTGLIARWKFDEDGQRNVEITAAPTKSAVYLFSDTGQRLRWNQAGSAFYKCIRRY